jgi:hypothetical protein
LGLGSTGLTDGAVDFASTSSFFALGATGAPGGSGTTAGMTVGMGSAMASTLADTTGSPALTPCTDENRVATSMDVVLWGWGGKAVVGEGVAAEVRLVAPAYPPHTAVPLLAGPATG